MRKIIFLLFFILTAYSIDIPDDVLDALKRNDIDEAEQRIALMMDNEKEDAINACIIGIHLSIEDENDSNLKMYYFILDQILNDNY